jgi:hypothetical protein
MGDSPSCYKPTSMQIRRFGKMIEPRWGENPRQATETVQMLVQALPPSHADSRSCNTAYTIHFAILRCRLFPSSPCLQQRTFLTQVTLRYSNKQSVSQDISGTRVKGVDGTGSISSQDKTLLYTNVFISAVRSLQQLVQNWL